MLVNILFATGMAFLIGGVIGFVWRLSASATPKDLSNKDIYTLLRGDLKWIIGFQTSILGGLLISILGALLSL